MPKRTDLKSILIIGAGPIVIGQACEFDYSGAQACKALRQEGYKVILVNSNPATIMTDPEMADVTYIEPITWQVLERIIEKERPDAILPTMGGQTALNCALDLHNQGVLDKYGVELIGARPAAIEKAEDRQNVGDDTDGHDDNTEGRAAGLPGQSHQRADEPADDELEEAEQSGPGTRPPAGTVERERRSVAHRQPQTGHVRQEEGHDRHQQRRGPAGVDFIGQRPQLPGRLIVAGKQDDPAD